MIFFSYLIFISFITFLLSHYALKNNILLNQTGEVHQKFAINNSVPLTGGLLILLSIFYEFQEFEKLLIAILLMFILGIISDLKIIKSSILRFFFQLVIIIGYVYFANLQIYDTRVQIIDRFLNNYYFNLFFVTFCILVVVNGSNFIDGMNSLTTTYYIIVLGILYKLQYFNNLNFQDSYFYMIQICMIILIFFNFRSKIFLGDSGSYTLGLLFSIFLINLYLDNPQISPFLIKSILKPINSMLSGLKTSTSLILSNISSPL